MSAEDPDGPKLFAPVCWDFPVPGMYTTSVLSYDEKLMGREWAWEPEMKVTSVSQYSSSFGLVFWFFVCFWKDLVVYLRLASNLESPCLRLPGAGDYS